MDKFCKICDQRGSFKQRLGRGTWRFLELMVEGYPISPTFDEQKKMIDFIRSLAYLYPCTECRPEFLAYVEKYPPDVKSRENLFRYFVNLKGFIKESISRYK